MPTSKKKSSGKTAFAAKKAAPAKTTRKAAAQADPPRAKRYGRRKKGKGVTRAIALRTAKRFGNPTDRMQARLRMEAQRCDDPTPLDPKEKLLRVKEAAALIGISHHTLRQWALRDKVVYRRIGGLLLMIPESEVARLRSFGN